MNLSNDIEVEIALDRFTPSPHQEAFWDGLFNKKYRRIFLLAARRSGKDFSCWNAMIRKALEKRVFILYCLPTFSQARRVIWDGMTFEGDKFLDFIPSKMISSINISMMRIEFINGSMICLAGSDNFKERLVGINPSIIVFSEWARCKPESFDFASPILAANKGTAIFLTTPYGKNHAFHMWEMAKELPDWLCIKRTIEDCQHIDPLELAKEQARMSPELYAQEYLVSFNRGISGAVFGKELNDIRENGQITTVHWEPGLEVNVSMDIGMRDATTLVYFQIVGDGTVIRVIDCDTFTGEGLSKVATLLQEKPYKYNKLFAPHDMTVKEWTQGGTTRLEKARQLGLNFQVLPQILIRDSIENCRTHFPKLWIDGKKCSKLVDALENYYRPWNEEKQVYDEKPMHNWASDLCFTGDTLVLTRTGMQPIMDIRQDTEVLTLSGWKKCSQAKLIQKNASLVEITFQDSTKVRCTPEHLFLTESGWISAEKLTPYSKIQSGLIPSRSILMENYIGYMKVKNISAEELMPCIEMFGARPLVKSHAAVTFITKIIKQLTILCGTLSAYLLVNTLRFLSLITKDLATKQGRLQLNGINLQREDYGIRDMPNEQRVGNFGKENRKIAYHATRNLWHLSETMEQDHKSIATTTASRPTVESVIHLAETADVYCITVPEAGHFALANGAIVKNCDGFRYMCQSLGMCKRGMTSEDFENIKRQALYGRMSTIPNQFQRPNW